MYKQKYNNVHVSFNQKQKSHRGRDFSSVAFANLYVKYYCSLFLLAIYKNGVSHIAIIISNIDPTVAIENIVGMSKIPKNAMNAKQ